MTGQQQQKTVTVQPRGSGEEHTVTVEPGMTPRETLAAAVGRQSENMLLRKGDRYLSAEGDTFQQVRQGDRLIAASNPKAGDR